MQVRNATFWFAIGLWSVSQPLLASPPLSGSVEPTKLSPAGDDKRALAKRIIAIVGPPLQMQIQQSERGAPAVDPVGYAAFLRADPRNKSRIARDPHFVEREIFRGTLLRQRLNPIKEARYAKFDKYWKIFTLINSQPMI